MFESPTTIIVGAGASLDFGLPSGPALWTRVRQTASAIANNLQQHRSSSPHYPAKNILQITARSSLRSEVLLRSLEEHGDGAIQRILNLQVAVLDSDVHPSVDDFLRDNPSLTVPTRALIASELFHCLYNGDDHNRWARTRRLTDLSYNPPDPLARPIPNWIRQFVGLCRGFLRDAPMTARVSIINFNYDRVMETVLRTFWDRAEQRFPDFDDCFEFLYPYGAFDGLPEELGRPADWILQQSNALGFAGSGSSASVDVIQSRMNNSRTIFMIGFSCGASNAALLGLDRYHAKRIFYQNYENWDTRLNRTLLKLGVDGQRADPGAMIALVSNGFFDQSAAEGDAERDAVYGSDD